MSYPIAHVQKVLNNHKLLKFWSVLEGGVVPLLCPGRIAGSSWDGEVRVS
jgi:hypothetical protein